MKIRFWLFVFLLSGSLVYSFEVTGSVICNESGILHLYICNETGFSIPLSGISTQIIRIVSNELKTNRCEYQFGDIPAGIYAVRGFLDLNENEKLDKGLFGPTEPWGMSFREMRKNRLVEFDEVCFVVTNSIRLDPIELK